MSQKRLARRLFSLEALDNRQLLTALIGEPSVPVDSTGLEAFVAACDEAGGGLSTNPDGTVECSVMESKDSDGIARTVDDNVRINVYVYDNHARDRADTFDTELIALSSTEVYADGDFAFGGVGLDVLTANTGNEQARIERLSNHAELPFESSGFTQTFPPLILVEPLPGYSYEHSMGPEWAEARTK